MEAFFTIEGLVGLALLTMVELVLVVDNALVVILQCKSLPESQRKWVERVGLLQGAIIRLILIAAISWLTALEAPIGIFENYLGLSVTFRNIVELCGGAILMWIAIQHYNNLGHYHHHTKTKTHSRWWEVLLQILGVNIIFSLDSVLSAVGTVESYSIMVAAILISIVVLLTAVGRISRLIESNPNLKVFALSLVFLIGGFLFAEGLGAHIDKSQLYAAMGFGLFVQAAYMLKREKLYGDPSELAEIESFNSALEEADTL